MLFHHHRHLRFCTFLAGASLLMSLSCYARDELPSKAEVLSLVKDANEVLADTDTIGAAKDAGKVFKAARILHQIGDHQSAEQFFVRGLQLSPWSLDEQIAYARLLIDLKRNKEATSIATMVEERAESDELNADARKLQGKTSQPEPPYAAAQSIEGPWVCLVRLGDVNMVAIQATMEKLRATLGIPVFLHEEQVQLGKAHRSAFSRWVRNDLTNKLNWRAPILRDYLNTHNASSPDEMPPSLVLEAILDALRYEGQTNDVRQLEEAAAFYRRHDQQWSASAITDYGHRSAQGVPGIRQAIVIGVTEADLYDGDNNYLFGSARTGGKMGVVSYARYRADFYGEPPDLARLTQRMHKQLLSTIGFALGVPRPTDPTSARSYPASLPEHDAKSEYMSEACIAGFERALGVTLPTQAHKPTTPR